MPSVNALPSNLAVSSIQILEFIEFSFRECGLFAEAQTPQLVNAGKQALQYILQDLSNRQVNLWLLEYVLFGSRAGQRQYTLPTGTIDIREANYRYPINPVPNTALPTTNLTAPNVFDRNLAGNPAVATAQDNWFGAYYSGGLRPLHLGINAFGDTTYTLVLEYSSDGIAWTNLIALPAVVLSDSSWNYWQIDGAPTANYWRVRSTTNVLQVRQIVLGNVQQDITLARLNRDDYFNLPNKDFQSIRALQFWYDRQVTPVMNLWPVPIDDFQIYQLLIEVQMPDVGNLGDTLYLPTRWVNAIQAMLSARLALQLPNVEMERFSVLQQMSQVAYQSAAAEERDKSPIYIRPNISYYTR